MQNKGYPLIVCADDYAQSPSIDKAILALIKAGRLSATSCMTLSPRWAQSAELLHEVRDKADIGLHLDFTQFSHAVRLSHPKLVLACLTGLISKTVIRQNIEQQLDAFEQAFGCHPDYIDGHLHVHQLPVIRTVLFDVLVARYGCLPASKRPWLRVANPPNGAGFKAGVIRYLGAKAFSKLAEKFGFNTSHLLLGVYDFKGETTDYFKHWKTWLEQLKAFYKAEQNSAHVPVVLMCHPSVEDSEQGDLLDPIARARVNEWMLLNSDEFNHWWDGSSVLLSRGHV